MSRALWFIGGVAAGGAAMYYGTKYVKNALSSLLGTPEGGAPATEVLKNAVAVHVRQIRRYAFASSQDLSPIVGLTHASYALVLLDTLEELIGQDAVRKAGYDPKKIRAFITTNQDKHAEKMKACDPHLQEVLAIERADENGQLPGFVLAEPPAQPWRDSRPFFSGAMSAPRGA